MANRFWRGGNGTWNTTSTTNWSTTSGGTGGATVPTAIDDVFFNAASGTGNYTLTIGSNVVCRSISLAKTTTGNLTVTGNVGFDVSIAGNVTANATGVTWGALGNWVLNAANATQIVSSGGLACPALNITGANTTVSVTGTLACPALTINSANVTVIANSGNITVSGTTTLTAGTLNLNNFELTANSFSSNNTNTRTIAFGTSGDINLTGNTTTIWSTAPTGLTITGTPTVNVTGTPTLGTRTIAAGALSESQPLNFNLTAGSDFITITGAVDDLTFNGFTGTLSNSTRTIYGNLTIGAGSTTMVMEANTNITTFASTGGVKTITSNGQTFNFPITFNGVGGTWQFTDNFSPSNASTLAQAFVTLTNGTLDCNNTVVRFWAFQSLGTATRSLSNINSLEIYGINSPTATFNINNTGFTRPDSFTVNFTASSSTGGVDATLGTGYTAANAINLNCTNYNALFDWSGEAGNVTFGNSSGGRLAGFAGGVGRTLYGNLILATNMTTTASTNNTTFSGPAGQTTIVDTKGKTIQFPLIFSGPTNWTAQLTSNLIQDAVNTRRVTLLSGTLNLNNNTMNTFGFQTSTANSRTLAFGTSGVINITGSGNTVWNGFTATNFNYTGNARVNYTYSGSTLTRVVAHGNAAGGSESTKAPPMFFQNGNDALNIIGNSYLSDLSFVGVSANTGYTGTLNAATRYIYGNLILGTGMTVTASTNGPFVFSATSGNMTLITNNTATNFPITVDAVGGTFRLSNTLNISTRNLTVNNGTFDANNFNVTTGVFLSSGTGNRTINISNSTINVISAGTVWDMSNSTNANLISSNSTILLSDTSAFTNTRTFAGGNLTYDNLVIAGLPAANVVTFTGNNTFTGTLSSIKPNAFTLQFTAGTTTTVGGFAVSGNVGNLVTIKSVTTAPHFLVKTGSGNVDVSYASISYSSASPSDTWYSLLDNNNIDGGNNTGWIFGSVPAATSNFFLLF